MTLHYADILRKPVITEKNTNLTPLGQYTFEVAPTANKIQIKEAVERIFEVKVRAVNVMNVKPKRKRVMRMRTMNVFGSKGGYKKAIVTLEPGHTIDIFGDI
ncbi:MAG TPA: 50S ribosomal protein L23 [Thermomicrobiales bacterium]|nr:50S ribosomal protein L23 [Thermomicrobiales bacterium]